MNKNSYFVAIYLSVFLKHLTDEALALRGSLLNNCTKFPVGGNEVFPYT